MANESSRTFKQKEEETKLVAFYKQLIGAEKDANGKDPSFDIVYQKRFLLQLLNTKITQVEPDANSKKNINYFLRISVMALSGIATILLGLKFGDNSKITPVVISNATLIITATTTFLSGLAVFWDIGNFWIRKKIMLNKLKELRYEYAFFLSGNEFVTSAKLRRYLDKFIACLGDEYWEKFLKDVSRDSGHSHSP